MENDDAWVRVASIRDLPEGGMLGVTAGDREIALFRLSEAEVRAICNICTHEFALLTDGVFEAEDGYVVCPLHAGEFDVRTGEGLCEPIEEDIAVFETRVEGDDIMVRLP